MDSSTPSSLQNEAQIEMILDNLIRNAIEAMAEKGGILTVKSDYSPSKEEVIIHVSDTGVGIPEENLDKLFTPFYSTKHSQGMGLALVSSLVNQLGGTIDVQSQVGKGSTFAVTLPWKETTTE